MPAASDISAEVEGLFLPLSSMHIWLLSALACVYRIAGRGSLSWISQRFGTWTQALMFKGYNGGDGTYEGDDEIPEDARGACKNP